MRLKLESQLLLRVEDAISGNRVGLSDYQGRVVLLDFFFTTCSPCIAAIDEELVPLYNQYYAANPNVEFLSIDVGGSTAQELRNFASEHGMKWPVLMHGSEVALDYCVEVYLQYSSSMQAEGSDVYSWVMVAAVSTPGRDRFPSWEAA